MAEQDNTSGVTDGRFDGSFARPGQSPYDSRTPYDQGAPSPAGRPSLPPDLAAVPAYEQTAVMPAASYPPPAPGATPYSAQSYAPAAAYAPSYGAGPGGYGPGAYPPPYGTPYGAPYGALPPAPAPRKRGALGRVGLVMGSLAAVGILAASTGLLTPAVSPVGSSGTGGLPTATAPANPAGQSGSSGQSGTSQSGQAGTGQSGTSQSGSAQGSGTASTSTKSNATAAQTKGVVLIDTTMTNGQAAGSGMVIGSDGLVLTNYHVVQGSTSVKVTVVASDKNYTAKVVGHDATNDVALLQLEGASGLDTVSFDNDPVTQGENVVAVGNAEGQGYLSAAAGQITDTSATVTVSNDSATGTETLKDVYETNAQAQPGDSGGPLFDTQNEVTGMTTAGQQTFAGPGSRSGRSGTGTATTVASYAIPIAKALAIVKTIEGGTSSGTVVVGANPYLGITVSSRGGAVVQTVGSDTPAAKAGLTAGSEITALGGKSVTSQAAVASALAGHNPGETISMSWTDAQGADHTADVTLGSSPIN